MAIRQASDPRQNEFCSDGFPFRLEKVRFSAPNAEMARGLEIFLTALAVGFAGCGPASADPLLREFSVCAGRFSALVEHQWLVDGPASEASAGTRDSLLALVGSVEEPGMAAIAMGWRIEAKAGQARLLSRAHFAQDPVAAARSADLLQACAELIGQS
jgi:hypothetical protein